MVFVKTSSEKADYVIYLEDHPFYRRNGIGIKWNNLDCIVTEGGFTYLSRYLSISGVESEEQRDAVKSEKVLIFEADLNYDVTRKLRDISEQKIKFKIEKFFVNLLSHLYSHKAPDACWRIPHNGKEMHKIIKRLSSKISYFSQSPVAELRNGIIAENIENHIVDRVKEIKNLNRKPRIGILYGIGHVSLTDNLKSTLRRKKSIQRLSDICKENGINLLKNIREAQFIGMKDFYGDGLKEEWDIRNL